MPKLFNTVTKKYDMVPASYAGKFPYEAVEEEVVEVSIVTEKVFNKPKKKKAEYNPSAIDADGDGLVQDGTVFERPVGTELSPEELTAIQESDSAL
jgi:flagellar basal body rod protein FlgC